MAKRDLHSALKTEIAATTSVEGNEFLIIKLQWSKEDIAYSLHVTPTSIFSGLQYADLLNHLGFQGGRCAFSPHSHCYATWVPPDFPLQDFARSFVEAFQALREAKQTLQQCGFYIEQPIQFSTSSDGHTSPQAELKKSSEDDHFIYIISWIQGGKDKGWTIHYRPKHPPLTVELKAAFDFLELNQFGECPYFDFEPCYWRFFPFEKRGQSIFDSNTDYVYRSFDNHSQKFSVGLESLLKVHSLLQPFGLYFLPQLKEPEPMPVTKVPPILPYAKGINDLETSEFDFDVAISFAGTERSYAEELAKIVRDAGYEVFYDDFYPEQLWGKDLVVFFDDIYRKRSRFCVIFASHEYNNRMWTTQERRSAQARALKEKGKEYILPIKVDDSELPGLPPTLGYLSLAGYGIERIADILIDKLNI